jgi:hypothetical protein
MAATFGATGLTDAFNVAFRIPNLFRRLFAREPSARPSCRPGPFEARMARKATHR